MKLEKWKICHIKGTIFIFFLVKSITINSFTPIYDISEKPKYNQIELSHNEIIEEHIKEFGISIASYIEQCGNNPEKIMSHYEIFYQAIKNTLSDEKEMKSIQKEIINSVNSKCIFFLSNHQFDEYHSWFKVLNYFMNK